MKTQLTKEQSQHLIDLGVPKEKASDKISYGFLGYDPIFRLTDILEILPKEIDHVGFLQMMVYKENWIASYNTNIKVFEQKELIDSLYELCVWCIENKYIKL